MTRTNTSAWNLILGGIVALAAILLLDAGRLVGAGADGKPDPKTQPKAETQAETQSAPATAEAVQVPTSDPVAMLRRGGPVMWVLAFCSIVLLAFVFERMAALRRSRVIPKPFVRRFLQQVRDGDLDRERALTICQDNHSPMAAIFAGAVRKWGRPAVEVEQAIIDSGERATYDLRRYLRVFTALAVIGPLLGLLGTVIGMIHAFNALPEKAAHGAAISESLSIGISEALLNTAFGLVIAIPAQSLYLYFVSKADRLIIEMDDFGQELVHLISAEDLQNRSDPQAKIRRPARKEPTA
jgi:biopolymer transport protein ExbB